MPQSHTPQHHFIRQQGTPVSMHGHSHISRQHHQFLSQFSSTFSHPAKHRVAAAFGHTLQHLLIVHAVHTRISITCSILASPVHRSFLSSQPSHQHTHSMLFSKFCFIFCSQQHQHTQQCTFIITLSTFGPPKFFSFLQTHFHPHRAVFTHTQTGHILALVQTKTFLTQHTFNFHSFHSLGFPPTFIRQGPQFKPKLSILQLPFFFSVFFPFLLFPFHFSPTSFPQVHIPFFSKQNFTNHFFPKGQGWAFWVPRGQPKNSFFFPHQGKDPPRVKQGAFLFSFRPKSLTQPIFFQPFQTQAFIFVFSLTKPFLGHSGISLFWANLSKKQGCSGLFLGQQGHCGASGFKATHSRPSTTTTHSFKAIFCPLKFPFFPFFPHHSFSTFSNFNFPLFGNPPWVTNFLFFLKTHFFLGNFTISFPFHSQGFST